MEYKENAELCHCKMAELVDENNESKEQDGNNYQ